MLSDNCTAEIGSANMLLDLKCEFSSNEVLPKLRTNFAIKYQIKFTLTCIKNKVYCK